MSDAKIGVTFRWGMGRVPILAVSAIADDIASNPCEQALRISFVRYLF